VNNLRACPVEIKWCPALPIYASEGFLKSVGDEYGWIGGTDGEGLLRCVLPYTIIRKFGFRFVRFLVETIPLEGEFDMQAEKSFLNSAVEYLSSTGADMIIPATGSTIFRTYPDGAVAAPYGTFVKDLTQPEDVLFCGVYPDYRANIRRATKKGVQIKCGMQYLDVSYRIIADTLKRGGSRYVKNYDDFKRSVLGLGENVRIFIADYQGVVQACLVAPFSEHSGYSLYSGTVLDPLKGSMHLVQWEAIRQFHGIGVKRFNFTGVRINPEKGSRQEGIKNFKMRFGGKLVQGYMWKYSLRPLRSVAYSFAVRLLKGGDVVDQERSKFVSE